MTDEERIAFLRGAYSVVDVVLMWLNETEHQHIDKKELYKFVGDISPRDILARKLVDVQTEM